MNILRYQVLNLTFFHLYKASVTFYLFIANGFEFGTSGFWTNYYVRQSYEGEINCERICLLNIYFCLIKMKEGILLFILKHL